MAMLCASPDVPSLVRQCDNDGFDDMRCLYISRRMFCTHQVLFVTLYILVVYKQTLIYYCGVFCLLQKRMTERPDKKLI